jgi:hypothetical protein
MFGDFLIKIQLTKSNPKIIRGVNPPCLMPIRIKSLVIIGANNRFDTFIIIQFDKFSLAI